MKRSLLLLSIIIISLSVFSQEICDNGIDDDGDNLVDMNDTADCFCNGSSSVSTVYYIPNPSFEDTLCCPSNFSQLSCADTWIQAGFATPDYLNTCGLIYNAATIAGLLPFPDGNGIAGAIFAPTWREYIGVCLSSPFVAGNTYTIEFDIASTPIDPMGDTCNGGVISYEDIDITIFGAPDCSDLTFTGADTCPPSPWYALGFDNYVPLDSWGTISITFTPTANVEAIIIGSPCTLPPTYTYGPCFPYFYYDNIIMNETSIFGLPLSENGSICTNDLSLSFIPDTIGTYQWYYNGVAMAGETNDTLYISANGYPTGDYMAVFTYGTECSSGLININYTFPVGDVASLPDLTHGCIIDMPQAPTATDNCGNTITGTTNAVFPITAQGTTTIMWIYDDGNGYISTQIQYAIITHIDNSVSISGIVLTANASGYNYQWLDCNNGFLPIAGETNQSFTPSVSGMYAVEISDSVCSVTSNCVVITDDEIIKFQNNLDILIYPNPITNVLNIDIGIISDVQIEIYDSSGKLIISKPVKTQLSSIDMSEYTSGVYLIKLNYNDKTISRKVQKK